MGNDNKRKGAGILLFHFPHVRDATSRCSSSCFGSMFSFPACTRDATSYLEASIDDNIFISRLYARCNIQYLAVSLVMLFSFPACTRDATIVLTGWQTKDSIFHFPLVREMQRRNRIRNFADLVFSFPACTRDATVWEKGNKTCGGTELFARTSFQPTSQPQFSLGIVDVWCRFAQAGTTEITSILSLSHKPRTV